MGKFIQGVFRPKNKGKYIGDVNNIIFRSSWEKLAFKHLDEMKNVIRWSSEEIVIPYKLIDHKKNIKVKRYYPDLYIEYKMDNGRIKKVLVEIKPYKETIPPKSKQGKPKKTLLYETKTWNINSSKWQAARAFCMKNNMEFQIWTEKTLFPNKEKMKERGKRMPRGRVFKRNK